ncbi:carbohydrate ABC transporter permease [Kribbella turkmenica]|uniref:carbohydrate ABC transporter permease n=1 Tax=Kribbella turkmenica TaxID=2530375 RepID=UPI00192D37E4|nr:carbohydrate ABC transporter permease [Kribbella turkmenica]
MGLVAVVVFGCLPTYWLVATALMPREEVFAPNRSFLPRAISLESFRTFSGNAELMQNLLNSVIVSSLTAILSVVVSILAAYSLSKFRYRGRGALMVLLLSGQLFPGALLLISLYLLLNTVGLLYTYTGLVLAFTTFTLPLTVFLLKGFFDALPDEILEAARLDGASNLAVLRRIALPLVAPGIATAGLFGFMRGWNDLLFALTLGGQDKRTLPAGLVQTFIYQGAADWPALMAASIVTSLPIVVTFVILQRFLVSGLSAGAVKG